MELLTVQEVAKILKVTTRTVYNLIARGELKATKVGGQYRISRESIDSIFERIKQ